MKRTVKQIIDDLHRNEGSPIASGGSSRGAGQDFKNLDRALVKIHSQYTRLKSADRFGRVRCFTCRQIFSYREVQEGHYVKRGKLPTKFLDMNTQPQCVKCNIELYGNLVIYAYRLDEKFGPGTAKTLEEFSAGDFKPTRGDYIKSISHYRSLVKAEKKRVCIV